MSQKPPRIASWLLSQFINDDIRYNAMGDFEEIFTSIAYKKGPAAARRWYWFQIIRSFPAFITDTLYWRSAMIRNFLIITLRNLVKQKTYSTINISGLAIGLACSVLIMLWVIDESKYDKFHQDSDRIYQVMENQSYSDGIQTQATTPGPLAETLIEEVPEIEHAASFSWNISKTFTKGDNTFREDGIYASPDFLNILTIHIERSSAKDFLVKPNTVLISQEAAKRYFGRENPIGEPIIIDRDQVYTVEGVFRKLPHNSSIQFDYILPFNMFLSENAWANRWESSVLRTIVKLRPETNSQAVNTRIEKLLKSKTEKAQRVDLFLYAYSDQYLYGQFDNGKVAGGRIEYVRLFAAIAIFILLIACINFINLSTARSTKRAKEVGIRKSIGASRGSLFGQFLGESIALTLIALVISVLLVEISLPLFNTITGKLIHIDYSDSYFTLLIITIALITGLASGSYPAFVLSSLQPVKTLKGIVKSSSLETFTRKGLVVFQFTLSIALIISTLVIYRQIEFTQTKNLGYKKENLINFVVGSDMKENWETIQQEILRDPNVISASRSDHWFLTATFSSDDVSWAEKDANRHTSFETVQVDYDLIETLGFEIIEGRSFSKEYASSNSKVIINESALNVMGFENPIGKKVRFKDADYEVVGVIKDFHFQSLQYAITPLIMELKPEHTYVAFARVRSKNISETIAHIEAQYDKFNPLIPFSYNFLDQQYASLYENETRVGVLARYFAIFAVIISCLGLFGLSAFTAEQRTREIGIRKVLGASIKSIVVLLSQDFTWLVLIALLISTPLSWILMNTWLSDFAYTQSIEWWLFPLAGISTICIAWLTTGYQSIKAALTDPIKTIKSE